VSTEHRRRAPLLHAGRRSAGVLGLVGTIACGASMVLVAVGVGTSAAATGMAAMSGTGPGAPHGVLGVLLRIGPWLLVGSVLLVTAAFWLTRRPATAILALLAGALLYAGMYAQPNLAVMYAAIAVGYTAWAPSTCGCAGRTHARHRPPAPRNHLPKGSDHPWPTVS